LSDGKNLTIAARGKAYAKLKSAGLFVACGHRVTFTPMADVLGRLG
jgi:hypothetical protein